MKSIKEINNIVVDTLEETRQKQYKGFKSIISMRLTQTEIKAYKRNRKQETILCLLLALLGVLLVSLISVA